MKLLKVKIDRCWGCPYYQTPSDNKVQLDWCYETGKLIENISTVPLPPWCPLPDLTEETDGQ